MHYKNEFYGNFADLWLKIIAYNLLLVLKMNGPKRKSKLEYPKAAEIAAEHPGNVNQTCKAVKAAIAVLVALPAHMAKFKVADSCSPIGTF